MPSEMFPEGYLPSALSAHTLHKHTHTVPGNAADTGSPTISVPDSHLLLTVSLFFCLLE